MLSSSGRLQRGQGDRALLARAEHAAEDLLAVKALAAAVLLHHDDGQALDGLIGREAPLAAAGIPGGGGCCLPSSAGRESTTLLSG